MVLDEAQAIKSNNSMRWQSLLNFKARNRLLLTGTPIQNSLTELWSLLHFIMHYERVTRWMLEEMPGRADITFTIGIDQSPMALPGALQN